NMCNASPSHVMPLTLSFPSVVFTTPAPHPRPAILNSSGYSWAQAVKINGFARDLQRMHAILPRAPGGVAHQLPIGGLIAGAAITRGIHKTLQPFQAVTVFALPILANASGCLPQNMAGQMRHPHPG